MSGFAYEILALDIEEEHAHLHVQGAIGVELDAGALRWLLFCAIPAALAALSPDVQEETVADGPDPGGRVAGPSAAEQPTLPFD